MKKLFLFFLIFVFFISCKEEPPLDEKKFMLVYIDLISFQESDSLHNSPENLNKFREKVFRKHGIRKDDYKKMIDYYNSKPELWDEFFQKTIKYVETKNDSALIN